MCHTGEDTAEGHSGGVPLLKIYLGGKDGQTVVSTFINPSR